MAKVGKVSKFDVLEKIAENGFAIVYKGRDPFTKRLVAIKLCIAEDESLRNRFLREAEGVARLYHPNIARILEFGSGDGKPYLVEEFLEGEDLRSRIRQAAPVVLVEELDLLLQVAHGLQYAHSKGVLHLDLKPATVHIERRGAVKLVDFGIARLAGAAISLGRPESGRPPRGYLPPEQALGLPADPRTDVYCFGALAYELLARRPPFTGLTPPELLQESLDETLKPLPGLWPDCPPELAALVDRCLQKSPGNRYRDLNELLDDLEPIQDRARLAAGRRRDDSDAAAGLERNPDLAAPGGAEAPPSLDDTMAIPPAGDETRDGGAGPRVEKVTTAYILEPPESEAPAPEGAETGEAERTPTSPSLAATATGPEPAAPPAPLAPAAAAPPPSPAPSRLPSVLRAAAARAGQLARHPRFPLAATAAVGLLALAALGIAGLARLGAPAKQAPAAEPTVPAPLPAPPPSQSHGLLVIDAVPWAEVVRVWDQDGKDVPLADSRHTPLALHVAPGIYQVALAHPEVPEPASCEGVVVIADGTGTCKLELTRVTVEDYLKAAGWWR